MIIGIGTDIIEIERIKKACSREAFLLRSFTMPEREFIAGRAEKAAGNFAVKEAVSKVFDTLAKRYENRNGGYTRILKLTERRGDDALMVVLELVD